MADNFNIQAIVSQMRKNYGKLDPQQQAGSLFNRPTAFPEVDESFIPQAIIPKVKPKTYPEAQTFGLGPDYFKQPEQTIDYTRPPLKEYKPQSFLETAANAIIPSVEAVELSNDSWYEDLLDKQIYDRGNTIIPALSIQPLVQSLENKDKIGFNPVTKTWSPHKSPEKGNDTIAYGHKLLDKEQDGNFVILEGEEVPFTELTENKAQQLFKQDWSLAKNQAKVWFGKDWNKIDNVAKELATELVFNMGPSVTKGKTEFSKFKRKAIAGQDYLSEINRTYDGGKPLTNRTNRLKDWATSLQ